MRPKKVNNRFLLFFATIALAFGFGSSLKQNSVTTTQAAAIPAGSTIYFKPNANWLTGGSRFAVYFFTDGGGNEWKDLVSEPDVLDIYKVISPVTEYQNLIFARMNPATTVNNWDNKYDQTVNLTYENDSPLFTLKEGEWNDATGNWGTYDPNDHPLPPSFVAGSAVYFRATSAFKIGATKMGAYFYVSPGSDPQWTVMDEVDTDIYKVLVPNLVGVNFDRVIFASLNETPAWVDDLPDWPNKVAQTGNLTQVHGKVLYDSADSSWKTFTERDSVTLTPTAEGIDINKVRIWLDRSGHYEEGFTWALKVGTTLYQPTGFIKAVTIASVDRFYAFYDMSKSVLTGNVGFSIVNSFLKVDLEIPGVPYVAGDNNKLWKVDYVASEWIFTKGAITDRIYNTFFASVLEGYLTCDANAENGYGAFAMLDENFLPRVSGVWNMEGLLAGVMIKDYESIGAYSTGVREVAANTDALAKYNLMAQKSATLPSGESISPYRMIQKTSTNVSLLVVISLFAFGALAFLKLRKKNA
ncbi:MAG: hypothetical protein WC968_01410 [Bacilli bacterium]